MAQLLDELIIQTRLTTLMRASDMAAITWALLHLNPTGTWQPAEPLLITSTTKAGARKTFTITGATAFTIINYVWRHMDKPAPYLIRRVDKPEICMGAERIAKRCLNIMTDLQIYTNAFKSHSLRGAKATYLAQAGVPLPWIQGRGGWSSLETLQKHYNTLHQNQD